MTENRNQSGESKRLQIKVLRRWILLALLIIALAASNVLHALVNGRKSALTAAPGELLYVSAFDAFDDEWNLYDGQQSAAIVDGRLQLTVNSPQTATWSTASHLFAEFDMSIKAEAAAGPIDNAFGIVFGLGGIDDVGCEQLVVALCGMSDWFPLLGAALGQYLETDGGANYYAFLISSDGYYSFRHVIAGEQKLLSAWIPSEYIRQELSAENMIRAVHHGSELRFYINGWQAMLCLSDEPMSTSTYAAGECIAGSMRDHYALDEPVSGRLGMIAESTQTGGAGVSVQFDNLIVKSPGYPSIEDARA